MAHTLSRHGEIEHAVDVKSGVDLMPLPKTGDIGIHDVVDPLHLQSADIRGIDLVKRAESAPAVVTVVSGPGIARGIEQSRRIEALRRQYCRQQGGQ